MVVAVVGRGVRAKQTSAVQNTCEEAGTVDDDRQPTQTFCQPIQPTLEFEAQVKRRGCFCAYAMHSTIHSHILL